jgi:hypothetical protein
VLVAVEVANSNSWRWYSGLLLLAAFLFVLNKTALFSAMKLAEVTSTLTRSK